MTESCQPPSRPAGRPRRYRLPPPVDARRERPRFDS
jgi:hypothetical protein